MYGYLSEMMMVVLLLYNAYVSFSTMCECLLLYKFKFNLWALNSIEMQQQPPPRIIIKLNLCAMQKLWGVGCRQMRKKMPLRETIVVCVTRVNFNEYRNSGKIECYPVFWNY